MSWACIIKGCKETVGEDQFIVLIVMMVPWKYTYVKAYQIGQFCMFICHLCLNKGICFKK